MNEVIECESEEAMLTFAAQLANTLKAGDIVFLHGELGSGKTTLARGIISGFGYQDHVKSPSFSLLEPYIFPNFNVYHFDLYRLDNIEELEEIGFRDYFNSSSICLIEWPEKVETYLPVPNLKIVIRHTTSGRELELSSNTISSDNIEKIIRNDA